MARNVPLLVIRPRMLKAAPFERQRFGKQKLLFDTLGFQDITFDQAGPLILNPGRTRLLGRDGSDRLGPELGQLPLPARPATAGLDVQASRGKVYEMLGMTQTQPVWERFNVIERALAAICGGTGGWGVARAGWLNTSRTMSLEREWSVWPFGPPFMFFSATPARSHESAVASSTLSGIMPGRACGSRGTEEGQEAESDKSKI